jgi:hypothetical protein
MDYKDFFYWLEGYLSDKLESNEVNLHPIVEKMSKISVENVEKVNIKTYESIPIPVNPFPVKDDPYKPPFEITC